MRWNVAHSTALSLGLLSQHHASEAFLVARRPASRTKRTLAIGSSSGLGWDNEDFLESLGKGDGALNEANKKYHDQKRRFSKYSEDGDDGGDNPLPVPSNPDELPDPTAGGTKGATISKEQVERIKKVNEEEESEGGTMFKKLMERARGGGETLKERPTPPPPSPPPPQAQGGGTQLPAGFENLPVEQQAALFRELMANPPQSFPPPPPPPAGGRRTAAAPDGRRIGRNRDADAIVNTSDVYFAQLKLDSSVRNVARHSGDEERAEAVFADPALREIKLHVNPHMEAERARERALFETAPGEMILPSMFVPDPPVDKSYAGISYKEKMAQLKKRKDGGAAKNPSAAKKPEPKKDPEPAAARKKTEPAAEKGNPKPVAEKDPVVKEPPSSVPDPVVAEKPKISKPRVAAAATTSETEVETGPKETTETKLKNPEEMRRDLRTLMGLLLKHKGGPGFGAGRIQGAEVERFERLAAEITDALQVEARVHPAPEEPAKQPTETAATTQQQAPATPPAAGAPPVAPPGPGGAIAQVPTQPVGDRINSMMACVEGAMQMYRNCPPELQGGMLVTLRAALLSAANTCNEIIANNEAANFEALRTVISDPHTRMQREVASSAPTQFTDVIPEKEEVQRPSSEPEAPMALDEEALVEMAEALLSAPTGNDENSQWLETVYIKLKHAAGDGKMGLRDDLTVEEAEELVSDILKMRSMLVEELENGIPEEAASVSSAMKYEELLAKARAKN